VETEVSIRIPAGGWHMELDSADQRWNGPRREAFELPNAKGEASLRLLAANAIVFSLANRF